MNVLHETVSIIITPMNIEELIRDAIGTGPKYPKRDNQLSEIVITKLFCMQNKTGSYSEKLTDEGSTEWEAGWRLSKKGKDATKSV